MPYGVVAIAGVAMFIAGIATHLVFPQVFIKLVAIVACALAIAGLAAAAGFYARSAEKSTWWPLPASVGKWLSATIGCCGPERQPPDTSPYSHFND